MTCPCDARIVKRLDMPTSKERAASAMHLLISLLLLVALLESSQCLSAEPLLWSSQRYPKETLGPTNWRYYRVDLPVGFSLLSISLTRNWDDEHTSSEATVPLVCFGFNGPPLVVPPVAQRSLLEVVVAAGEVRNASATGECGWFNESIVVNVTNSEILSGLMHIGIYSAIGATRTQSHMISRGKVYKFAMDVQIFYCSSEEYGGLEFSERISHSLETVFISGYDKKYTPDQDRSEEQRLVPAPSPNGDTGRDTLSGRVPKIIWYSSEECLKLGETRHFSFRVDTFVPEMIIKSQCDRTNSSGGEAHQNTPKCPELVENHVIVVLLQLRYGALPSKARSDYTRYLSSGPLLVASPRRGWWYLSISIPNITSTRGSMTSAGDELCLTMHRGLQSCGSNFIGNNCEWTVLPLTRILLAEVESPFDSYYFPMTDSTALESGSRWFSLLPPLDTSSAEMWEYFTLEIPIGASGGVLSISVKTSASINVEFYARFESCPADSSWDYGPSELDILDEPKHAGDSGSLVDNSHNVSRGKSQKELKLSLDIVYPKEGTWCLGLKSIPALSSSDETLEINTPRANPSTEMQIILHGCPNRCSGHGKCRPDREAGRLHFISHCSCDVAHGDFDCSTILLAPGKKMQETWVLTFSNAAAILPSVWAIRHQAYAEWITFMLSGFSSAVYHSCDSGGWCAMSFSTLQFLDFWLSFLVTIMTCLYMAGFVGPKQGMMHIGCAVLTATIAQRNATSAWNVLLVVVMGVTALLLGWGLETRKGNALTSPSWLQSLTLDSTVLTRFLRWTRSLYTDFRYKFRWPYMACGLVFLFNAILSLYLEAAKTYWIWHSWWHVSIYTCAFFMLLSVLPSDHRPDASSYEVLVQRNRNRLEVSELNPLPQS